MEIKNHMIDYIREREISLGDIINNTKVPREKFEKDSLQDLNATEFFEICRYLKVDPKEFYVKKLTKNKDGEEKEYGNG